MFKGFSDMLAQQRTAVMKQRKREADESVVGVPSVCLFFAFSRNDTTKNNNNNNNTNKVVLSLSVSSRQVFCLFFSDGFFYLFRPANVSRVCLVMCSILLKMRNGWNGTAWGKKKIKLLFWWGCFSLSFSRPEQRSTCPGGQYFQLWHRTGRYCWARHWQPPVEGDARTVENRKRKRKKNSCDVCVCVCVVVVLLIPPPLSLSLFTPDRCVHDFFFVFVIHLPP
jgi:hypothetical protein